MRKAIFVGMLLLAGVANATLTGLATDKVEPAWRGQANTTLQAWSFSTGDNPAVLAVETVNENPFGTPSAEVFVPDAPTSFPLQTYWMSSNGNGHKGVWRIYSDDYLMLHIPNTQITNPDSYKEIWLQITYSAGSIDRKPQIQTLPAYASLEVIQSTTIDSLYYHDIFRITLKPNPTEEWIAILPRDCTIYIDELVVDTVCIPEPATMLILGLGVVLLRKFK
jgi:hypothetical protein